MIMDLLRFFLKCCLFVLAVGGGYELAVYNNLFPHPPPDWVKFVGDARDASSNLAAAVAGLKEGTQNLVAPVTSALQLANQIIDKQMTDKVSYPPNVPNVLPVPATAPAIPQVSVDVSKASAEAVKPLADAPKKLEEDRKKKLDKARKDPTKAVANPASPIQ
jgi:hypothetical protein